MLSAQVCSAYCAIKLLFETFYLSLVLYELYAKMLERLFDFEIIFHTLKGVFSSRRPIFCNYLGAMHIEPINILTQKHQAQPSVHRHNTFKLKPKLPLRASEAGAEKKLYVTENGGSPASLKHHTLFIIRIPRLQQANPFRKG